MTHFIFETACWHPLRLLGDCFLEDVFLGAGMNMSLNETLTAGCVAAVSDGAKENDVSVFSLYSLVFYVFFISLQCIWLHSMEPSVITLLVVLLVSCSNYPYIRNVTLFHKPQMAAVQEKTSLLWNVSFAGLRKKQLPFKIDISDILKLDILFLRGLFLQLTAIDVTHSIKGSETFQGNKKNKKSLFTRFTRNTILQKWTQ